MNQGLNNAAIIPVLFQENPQVALQALQQFACQNQGNIGGMFVGFALGLLQTRGLPEVGERVRIPPRLWPVIGGIAAAWAFLLVWAEAQKGLHKNELPGPVVPPYQPPTPIPTQSNIQVQIWRGVGGNKKKGYWKNPELKARSFRPNPAKDSDGLSMFEFDNLPENNVTPFAYPFSLLLQGQKAPHVTGTLVEVPTCNGTYTPEHGAGHWSVNCTGTNTIDVLLSDYAAGHRDLTILYPNFIGEFAEDRRFEWVE